MTDSDNTDTLDYSRIAVDADVLATDLLVGGSAREALDSIRRHSWLDAVLTEQTLDDAEGVIATLTTGEFAAAWRAKVEPWAILVDQPDRDHPGLAAAYRGKAAHLLSMDTELVTPEAGVTLREAMDVSIRTPNAFVSVFDPAAAYALLFDDEYPGPDQDPRQ